MLFSYDVENIARIAKAASHKLPGKLSSNVSFVCPVCPDDHDEHDDHDNDYHDGHDDHGKGRYSPVCLV